MCKLPCSLPVWRVNMLAKSNYSLNLRTFLLFHFNEFFKLSSRLCRRYCDLWKKVPMWSVGDNGNWMQKTGCGQSFTEHADTWNPSDRMETGQQLWPGVSVICTDAIRLYRNSRSCYQTDRVKDLQVMSVVKSSDSVPAVLCHAQEKSKLNC